MMNYSYGVSFKMFTRKELLLILSFFKLQTYAQFVIPDVTLEAYTPKGFRASIPALPGIQLFAFHGNVNKDISQVDPGDYNHDTTSPEDDRWSYYNDELTLKKGDVVNYWIFIQYEKLGYRKDNQHWTVNEVLSQDIRKCEPSRTVAAGKSIICKNSVIFEDSFVSPNIDNTKWIVEQYIPTESEDYEFVSYQESTCRISNNRLIIKPVVAPRRSDVEGELDLRSKCTKRNIDECFYAADRVFIAPPVTSGKIVSLLNFRYGEIEIKAKLPAGDWIYPQMYLQRVQEPTHKLWIGYARGNENLISPSTQQDIGAKLLFGGPVLSPVEPQRSQYLRSATSSTPYTSQLHTFTVVWAPDGIVLKLDGIEYGSITATEMKEIKFSQKDLVRLVIGIGVGGVNDFPDGFNSGGDPKPWDNRDRVQVSKFFNAKDKWIKTWAGDKPTFQIASVKVTAI